MAKFFFDVRHGALVGRDNEGSEHSDLDGAAHYAAEAAYEICRGGLPDRRPGRLIAIQVRNEAGIHVLTATVSLEVQKV